MDDMMMLKVMVSCLCTGDDVSGPCHLGLPQTGDPNIITKDATIK